MYVTALQRAGHDVTYVMLHDTNLADRGYVKPLPAAERYQRLADLAVTHDVVVIQSPPVIECLLQHPALMRRALIIDNHPYALSERQQRSLVDAVASHNIKYVTTDVACEGHVGRLINQCVPFDRAPLVEADPRLLVACGRIVPIKLMDVAAAAMVELNKYGYHSVLVSTDIPLSFTTKYNIDIRTDVSHSDLMHLIGRASCLIHPSLKEKNGSCIAFEAAAHGTPVVHYVANADYFLVPTGCSRRITESTVGQIVQAVLNNQPADRERARDWCDAHFSEAQFVKRLEGWLNHVVGGPVPVDL